MLLPFDPLLSVVVGGHRWSTRLSTPLVLIVVVVGASRNVGLPANAIPAIVLALLAGFLLPAFARLWAIRRCDGGRPRLRLLTFGVAVEAPDDMVPRRLVLLGGAGVLTAALLATGPVVAVAWSRSESTAVPPALRVVATLLGGLALLQAMPALPLDGGRMARGAVWYLTDRAETGTRFVATYGQVVASGLITGGVVGFGFGGAAPYWGFGALVAGWQLSGEIRAEADRLRWGRRARSTPLADLVALVPTVNRSASIDESVEALIAAGHDAPVLVVDETGCGVGVVRFADLRACRRALWSTTPVGALATPLTGLRCLPPEAMVTDALAALEADDAPRGRRDRRAAVIVVGREGACPSMVLDRRQIVRRLLAADRTSDDRVADAEPGSATGG